MQGTDQSSEAPFRVLLVQHAACWQDVDATLSRLEGLLASPPAADLIVLPELFASGFSMEGRAATACRYEEVHRWMAALALRTQALVVGSTVFRAEDGAYFNRLLALYPGGDTVFYDKRHLFVLGGEDRYFSAGGRRVRLEYKGVRIAPFICYDLRFPVWCRNTDHYDLAVFVAQWPQGRRQVWQTLLRARAIENQAYVVGVNGVGTDGNGLTYAGDSAVISPRGEEVAFCEPFSETLCLATVDMAKLRAFRREFPVLRDRDVFFLGAVDIESD